eukprot:9403256-Pyramimonas_sp.AAC.1
MGHLARNCTKPKQFTKGGKGGKGGKGKGYRVTYGSYMKGKIGGKQGGKGSGSRGGSYGGQGKFTPHSERE